MKHSRIGAQPDSRLHAAKPHSGTFEPRGPLMPLKLQHDEMPAMNLTSMIDVLFLLIIFFMVAAKFDEMERNIEVDVPQVAQAGDNAPPQQPLVVSVAP